MIAASKAQLTRSVCRESYADFFKTFWHTVSAEELVWNWHIQLMCDEIQAVCERIFAKADKEYDPIWNVPPGTSKSTTCSVLLPAWCWTRMPSFAFLGASHGLELALDLSRKTRDCVRSELYRACFPNLMIREDQDTKGKFMTTAGGVRQAIGSGGSIIGVHFDLIVIDDPIDPQKVVSEAELAEVNLWIEQTLSQRKKSHRRSVTMMVMQRLHQNDPSARMAERGKDRVKHFVIPATTEYKVNPPELAENYVDGLMDPQRLPKPVLNEKRVELGDYGFAGQYGQDPKPAGGGLFKTDLVSWGDERRPMKQVVRYWDKAATSSANPRARKAAWTVGVRMEQDQDGYYWVTDVVRLRVDTFARERVIKRTALRDTHKTIIGVEQEGASGGVDSAKVTVRNLAGFRVLVSKARQNKEARAYAFSVIVNQGMLKLPDRMRKDGHWVGWAKDLIDELSYWPFSTFRDQGDAASGAFNLLQTSQLRPGPVGRKNKKAGTLVLGRRRL